MAIMRTQEPISLGTEAARQITNSLPRRMAASTVDSKPHPAFAAWGVFLVVVGAIGGWVLFRWWDPDPFRPASDYSVFAGLFVVAAAVERFLEPFAAYVGPDTSKTKNELESAIAESGSNASEDAANKQEQLNRERSERAFLLWGVATLFAMLLCAGFGLLMLRAVSAERVPAAAVSVEVLAEEGPEQPAKDPNRFLDLLVTGLVVGAGTKPLHDLIGRLQKSKEKATDPPETGS